MTATFFKQAASMSGVALLSMMTAGCETNESGPQGWSDDTRAYWYEETQGSRLVPLSWFNALEQPDSVAAFADPTWLQSFGYLPAREGRPNALPVGFAIDRQKDEAFKVTGLRWYAGQTGKNEKDAEPWVGLNCAACHTAELRYNGAPIRVDGGPGYADHQSFVEALDKSVEQTLADPARWERFAAKVLAGKDTPANREALQKAVGEFAAWERKVDEINETPMRYGFARVDAFGHIYNKVALYNGAEDQTPNPADAPVSYPFLWNISKQVRVQWNGAAKNATVKLPGGPLEYGALGRNAGEVIGVFGEVVIEPASSLPGKFTGYKSSVQSKRLIELELALDKLQSPSWPTAFPKIDETLRARGNVLFDQMCASCHLPKDKWATEGKIDKEKDQGIERMSTLVSMKASGDLTDIWMACNSVTQVALTGKLEGTKIGFISGDPLPAEAPLITQLSTTVKGTLIGDKKELLEKAVAILFGVNSRPKVFTMDENTTEEQLREQRRAFCEAPIADAALAPMLSYKARPLDGIWATAPYLHNGSVPTLYHLLQAPADRPKSFWLGSRDYDPKFVGYVWKDKPAGAAFEFRAVNESNKPVDGNGNQGHVYGVDRLSEADRWALVEYMKSL